MMVFRKAALAWAAVGCLFVSSLSTVAQEQPEPEQPKLVTRSYDTRGMVTNELARSPANGGVGDMLAPDRLFNQGGGVPDHELDTWTLRDSGDEARCWDNAGELMSHVLEFCGSGGQPYEFLGVETGNSQRVRLNATEETHKRVQWALNSLREIVRARVSIKVYKLAGEGEVGGGTLTAKQSEQAIKSAKLVGTMRGGLGERMVLQRLQHQSFVADYSLNSATGAVAPVSEVRDLRTGEEIVAGAIVLANGRVWVQGWHAGASLAEMRKQDTSGGQVELPRLNYSYTPISATLERGAATILDAGLQSRFMLQVDCDSAIADRKLECGNGLTLELRNVANVLRGMGPSCRWLMTPNVNSVTADGVPLEQVFVEEPIDGPYNDAAKHVRETLSDRVCSTGTVQLFVIGPWLGVVTQKPGAEDADGNAAHAKCVELLNQSLTAMDNDSRALTMRVRAWIVRPNEQLPQGIVDGKPGDADVDALASLGSVCIDRTTSNQLDQRVDFMDITLAAHVRDYVAHVATEAAGYDPVIGVQVQGKQVRWLARQSDEGKVQFELRAGITVGDEKFEQIPWGDKKQWAIERSRTDLAQVELTADLAAGDRAATVCPGAGPNGSLLVIVVERKK